MGFFGDVIDNVGTFFNAPELGLSESATGGKATSNTGRVQYYQGNTPQTVRLSNGQVVADPNQRDFLNALNSKQPSYSSGTGAPTGQASVGVQQSGGGGGVYSTSAGGGGGGAYVDPAAIQYYNDQEAQARQAIARLNAQRGIGEGNINNSYQSALNQLLGTNAQAERDASLTKQRTIDDNVTARSTVDQTVARQAQGLRRLLGNSSSAAEYAAPLAVARQGNQQQGAIQTTFGRNLQNIDIADEDRKRQFGQSQEDLNNQVTQQRNALNAGLLQTEAGLNETLSGIALQRAQAQGQNYAQARGQLTPYNDRVSSLLSQIDQLGANPSIAAKNVSFTAPTLDQYNTSGINVAQGQGPQQAQAGQYANLLNAEDRKKKLF